ncbi:alpha/beta fold hydrolase [Corynebacterium sp. sy017]|uniref:alpha/beta hydrolase n=1 Tax=unclassified Corynebacterium TaxID=2624378 RepID=UPI00118694A3|nr:MULTISPECIES: alpha/beta hydrolase [unclassified Corynebacterium]MBP3088572.1 alpha/beta fold hydrolase [Corynebacterium sp. sy017]QDZ41983.1 lysophospholipase [Corynebacterium sp. sy039]TSD91869.1 alpha/beta fold hydrolase [Corynebacterium sp. SY003]
MHIRKKILSIALAAATTGSMAYADIPAQAADITGSTAVAINARTEEGYLTSTDNKGTRIYWKSQTIPGAKGNVVVVHGAAEHSGRYDYVADRLLAAGYNVYRLDHRGHGKSALPELGNQVVRGHIDDFHFLVDDINQVVQKAKAQHPEVKTYMLGHSMGALAAQFYGIKYNGEVAGIISNGGGTPLNFSGRKDSGNTITPRDMSEAQKALGPTLSERLPLDLLTTTPVNTQALTGLIPGAINFHWASAPLTDQLQVPNAFTDGVASDPAVTAQYQTDPLVNKKLSIGMAQQMVFAALYDGVNAQNFTTPTLITHGTKDGIVPSYFAKDWYNSIASTDKELVYWENQMHEVFNEPAKHEAMDKVIDWLAKH